MMEMVFTLGEWIEHKKLQLLYMLTTVYTTKTGKVLTDKDINRLADEAERGYDVSQLKERADDQPHR